MKTFHVFFSVSNNYRCWSMKRERKTTSKQLSVCVRMFTCFALTWLTLEIDGLQELQCYWLQYYQYTPVRLTGCFIYKHWTSTATMFAFTLFKSSTQFTKKTSLIYPLTMSICSLFKSWPPFSNKRLISSLTMFVCTLNCHHNLPTNT